MKIENMNSKTTAIILIIILAMTVLAGCGDDSSDNNTSADEVVGDIKVTLSIDFPDSNNQADVEDVAMGLTSESSALDLLFAYANENNLEIETEGDEETLYVKSIGGVAANDDSGWIYTINDDTILESAGKAMLNDGDEVEWEFVKVGED